MRMNYSEYYFDVNDDQQMLQYLNNIAQMARQATCRIPPGEKYISQPQTFVGHTVDSVIKYPDTRK